MKKIITILFLLSFILAMGSSPEANSVGCVSRVTRVDPAGEPLEIVYYDSGAPVATKTIVDRWHGQIQVNGVIPDKVINYFDINNKLISKNNYKNGVFHGPYETYYDNGKVYSKGIYQNGKIQGLVKVFYKNGLVKEEGLYRDGLRVGEFKSYYDDGTLAIHTNYKNGLRQGYTKLFDKAGNLAERGEYLMGGKNGEWKKYWENGEVAFKDYYVNGEKMDKDTYSERSRKEYHQDYNDKWQESDKQD